jgi:hypothetical protein
MGHNPRMELCPKQLKKLKKMGEMGFSGKLGENGKLAKWAAGGGWVDRREADGGVAVVGEVAVGSGCG